MMDNQGNAVARAMFAIGTALAWPPTGVGIGWTVVPAGTGNGMARDRTGAQTNTPPGV